METPDMTAKEIQRIRNKYGLSQKAFARVLGIGEASIVRYENGSRPTRAIANLIRAADRPEFMLDCLERDRDRLSPAQYDKTSKIIYSIVRLNENGEVMDIDQIYEVTLQQEILNEKAARIMADIHRLQDKAHEAGDEQLAEWLELVVRDIAILKPTITGSEGSTLSGLKELKGRMEALEHIARIAFAKAA